MVNWLIDEGKATQEKIDELDKQSKDTAKAAIKFAEESPDLPMNEMYTDVYANPFKYYKKGDLPAIITNGNSGE